MSEVGVEFGALGTGAAGISSMHRALQGTLENLESQLAPMVSTWTGQAREACFARKKKRDGASASMEAVPQQMGQVVDRPNAGCQVAATSDAGLWF
jgi:early secretory antigenic target protein ESAT-6